ncbi:glycosyltransferase family 4 protein [Candidatus Woesearchaeota archaeon]|nr:glycosyltransferase family 4 protein [Candidatus Woesearchaeota archaeon]
MRICFVNPTLLIRRPIAELVGKLAQENDTGVLVPRPLFRKVNTDWHANEHLSHAKIYSYAAINIPFIRFEWPIPISPFYFIHLITIYRRYDVIHSWTYFYLSSVFVALARLCMGKKLIVSADTLPGYSFNPGKTTTALFKIYTRVFRGIVFGLADKVHLYGKSLLRFSRVINVPTKRISVIPTGINLDKFKSAKPAPRGKLGLSKQDIVFCYAGLLVPRKGIDIIINTIDKLRHEGLPAKALIIGSIIGNSPHEKMYINLVKEKGLEKDIIFTGWRKDIPELFKASDVLFLPSRGEGLPGIVMEGMACGLPVLSTDIPCIPDLVQNTRNGYLCKLDDKLAFLQAARKLVNDKNSRQNMGKESIKLIEDFSWENILPRYMEMYR